MSRDMQAPSDLLVQQIAQLTEQHRYEEALIPATTILNLVRQSDGELSSSCAIGLNTQAMNEKRNAKAKLMG